MYIYVRTYVLGEAMTREYLEKIQNQLLEKKIELEKAVVSMDNTMKENTKFIQLLDETNDPNYESFTPRTVNVRNKEKIQQLKEEQKKILEEKKEIGVELADIRIRLDECKAVIKYERERESLIENSKQDNTNENNTNYKLKLLEAQEGERQRIARELHDSTVQDLTSMLHKIELSKKVMDVDLQRCKLELSNVSDNIKNIIRKTREMIYNLRPMSLDDIGIDVTLERGIAKIEEEKNCKIEYMVIGEPFHVKPVVALSLLRIMQEACNNAIKHAKTNQICVVLEYTDKNISLVVQDYGVGFDIEAINQKIVSEENTGFGLSMMRERVHLLSGKMKIESKKGEGTTICIEVPNFREENIGGEN